MPSAVNCFLNAVCRQMVDILKEMKSAIDEGVAAKAVQLVPHFVLLRRSFYFKRLLVPLANFNNS